MILLLGASGYVGQVFSSELRRRRRSFIPLTRQAIDYTSFDVLFNYVRKIKPEFIIQCGGLRAQAQRGRLRIGAGRGVVVRMRCSPKPSHGSAS